MHYYLVIENTYEPSMFSLFGKFEVLWTFLLLSQYCARSQIDDISHSDLLSVNK